MFFGAGSERTVSGFRRSNRTDVGSAFCIFHQPFLCVTSGHKWPIDVEEGRALNRAFVEGGFSLKLASN